MENPFDFCHPAKPALKFTNMSYESHISFLQSKEILVVARKNDFIWLWTEYSICAVVVGRRITCTHSGFTITKSHFLTVHSPFHFYLILGWGKKNVVHGMFTAFQIVHKKMPLTPTAALHLTQALQGGRMKWEQIEGLQKYNQHLILKNYSIIKCIYQETDLQLTIWISQGTRGGMEVPQTHLKMERLLNLNSYIKQTTKLQVWWVYLMKIWKVCFNVLVPNNVLV